MKKFLFVLLAFFISCETFDENLNFNYSKSELNNSPVEIILDAVNTELFFTIKNITDERILISLFDIPINEFGKDMFVIFDGKNYIQYEGKYITKKINMWDWQALKVNQSLTFSVHLEDYYRFENLGFHDVYYDSVVTIQYKDQSIKQYQTVSNTVELYILSYLPPFSQNRQIECTDKQLTELNQAKNRGELYSKDSLQHLKKYGIDDLYIQWFGQPDENRLDFVKNGYSKMLPAFDRSWQFSCETRQTNENCRFALAWVFKSRPYQVNVCVNNLWYLDENGKGGLMVHEASHWNVTFSANDHAYHSQNCLNLAKNDPDKAIVNADSIKFFSSQVDKFEPPTTGNIIIRSEYKINEVIRVFFRWLEPDNKGWLGLYLSGANNNNFLQKISTEGKEMDVVAFTGLSLAGIYEIRLFPDEGFIAGDVKEFEVVNDVPIVESIEIKEKIYNPKEKINITISNFDNLKQYKLSILGKNDKIIKEKDITGNIKKKYKMKTPRKKGIYKLCLFHEKTILDFVEFEVRDK